MNLVLKVTSDIYQQSCDNNSKLPIFIDYFCKLGSSTSFHREREELNKEIVTWSNSFSFYCLAG